MITRNDYEKQEATLKQPVINPHKKAVVRPWCR